MLTVGDLHAYYGKSHVLQGVSLTVGQGEAVGLLGRNGAGKTTTLKSIMGLVKHREGRLEFEGQDLRRLEPYQIAARGLGYVPEHRGIFARLSVEENLQIAARRGAAWSVQEVYRVFPPLRERRRMGASSLSGGEQQMLAIARALVGDPKLVLLDEPSQGLAPVVLKEVARIIDRVKAAGIAVLLVEQNLPFCLRVAERVYVLDSGRMVYEGSRQAFAAAEEVQARYLTLGGAAPATAAATRG